MTTRAFSLLLFTLPALAQTASTKPEPKTPPTGQLTGKLFCSDTHKPARGAHVLIIPLLSGEDDDRPAINSQLFSASDGSYTVRNIAPGAYIVTASFPGYLDTTQAALSAGVLTLDDKDGSKAAARLQHFPSVTIEASKTATFDLTLTRGATVTGRVLYPDGSPAPAIVVALEEAAKTPPKDATERANADFQSAVSHRPPAPRVTTDDQGRFRIAGVDPGAYRIAAIYADAAPSDYGDMSAVTQPEHNPASILVYAGGTLSPANATTFDLRTGEEITATDITLPLETFHEVNGAVAARDGRPINSANLTLKGDAGDFATKVLADGSFAFPNVPAGTYTLSASNAAINAIDPETEDNRFPTSIATNAFANGDMSVIVKDDDVLDIALTLTEVPLPPRSRKPAPSGDDSAPN